jgi:hypothetical protein
MREKMDRTAVSFGTAKEHDKKDREYWAKADPKEKLQTITYLRECFYGSEATTGRLQRVYRFIKRKSSGRHQDLADAENLQGKKIKKKKR